MRALKTKAAAAAAAAVLAMTAATLAVAYPGSKDGMGKADKNATATAHEPSVSTAQMVKAEPAQVQQLSHWIDVRTPQEYAGGHLDAASNIPYSEIAQRIAEVTTDRNAEINLYCRSGRRSGIAAGILLRMGYTNVHNRGGYRQLVGQAQ